MQKPYFKVTPRSQKGEISLGRNPDPEKLFDALLKKKFSQLARKYSGELVFKIWGKVKITDADEAYFSACGWKPEMTIMEALNCLDEYCNYIEQVIQDYQKRN